MTPQLPRALTHNIDLLLGEFPSEDAPHLAVPLDKRLDLSFLTAVRRYTQRMTTNQLFSPTNFIMFGRIAPLSYLKGGTRAAKPHLHVRAFNLNISSILPSVSNNAASLSQFVRCYSIAPEVALLTAEEGYIASVALAVRQFILRDTVPHAKVTDSSLSRLPARAKDELHTRLFSFESSLMANLLEQAVAVALDPTADPTADPTTKLYVPVDTAKLVAWRNDTWDALNARLATLPPNFADPNAWVRMWLADLLPAAGMDASTQETRALMAQELHPTHKISIG